MKELDVPLMKSSLNDRIRISKNKKIKDKNTNLEKDTEYMASTDNKKSRSVLSPTHLVTNVEQCEGPEKEIAHDTTHETGEEIGEGVTRPTRGITCGKGARNAMKVSKKKLPLEFNIQMLRVVCQNDSSFMHMCGYILRTNCSLQYKDWRLVPNVDRTTLRHKLTTLFDIDVENSNVRKVIDSYMSRTWRGHRATLHAYFKEIGGEADPTKAKTTHPSDVKKEDWEYLCDM
ncbi:hypothetical protein M8C21_013244 [Ambrosia artemisiifolia]|uniref:Uncharacterized protein n=1 Tax=Ambrosia artemisiifolia TaxID=4212 RepID=A0AAD5G550_AMBAR|nr:hypothetical protein M8C21_013244 [Ambrosia artemisiifolia]